MNRLSIPTLALALTGTLALAACADNSVETAADNQPLPDTTAAADPSVTDETPRLQDDALDRADRDVRTMGDVDDPYYEDRIELEAERIDERMDRAADEVEQEIEEAEREIRD